MPRIFPGRPRQASNGILPFAPDFGHSEMRQSSICAIICGYGTTQQFKKNVGLTCAMVRVSISLRLKDLLGPETRVKREKNKQVPGFMLPNERDLRPGLPTWLDLWGVPRQLTKTCRVCTMTMTKPGRLSTITIWNKSTAWESRPALSRTNHETPVFNTTITEII